MPVSPHLFNLAVHLGAGIAAMALGFLMLASPKGSFAHRKRGRLFVGLTLLVCATAVIGNVFFRFQALFAILTVLVSYQLLSGWHVIYTKSAGPNWIDALLAVAATTWTAFLIPMLLSGPRSAALSVIYSSLGAIVFLLLYDTARWCFPRRWHAMLWRYEHIYKLNAALFAMLSAAVGNLVRIGQPWSQLAPSVLGFGVVLWFFWRTYRSHVGAAVSAMPRETDAIGEAAGTAGPALPP